MFYFHSYLGKISNLTNVFSSGLKHVGFHQSDVETEADSWICFFHVICLRIVPSQITIVKQHMGGMFSHLFQASYKQIQGFMFGLEIMFLEF